ncbi:MAG: cyclodeaminase/cyclohydrolase family protein [Chloroflexia bacterium]
MSEAFLQKTVEEFLNELASKAPVPGGGSVSALSGALAAGLVTMVCDLTIGKKQYAEVEEEIRRYREEAENLRLRLQGLIQADVEAYGRLAAAYKLPRETEEEQADRYAAVQEATMEATRVPLEIAEAARRVVELSGPVAEKGSRLAVSDAGIAALLGEAAVHSALLNVKINLPTIEDEPFVAEARRRMKKVLAGLAERREAILRTVEERL